VVDILCKRNAKVMIRLKRISSCSTARRAYRQTRRKQVL